MLEKTLIKKLSWTNVNQREAAEEASTITKESMLTVNGYNEAK
jgi:hypothetical protein